MPDVSIVIPVYNVEQYLKRCLDSLLAQTHRDYDVVLVDDGSTDQSGNICDDYAKNDSRFHVIHQTNAGVSAARNVGIGWCKEKSSSRYIAFVDSDDWVHPQYLEVLISAAASAHTEISVVGFEQTPGPSPAVDLSNAQVECITPDAFFCEDYTHLTVVWGKLYPKAAFDTISFPVGKIHEDEYVTWKILFSYDKLAIVRQPLYAYFKNTTGIMGSTWSLKRLDMLDALEERLVFFKNHQHLEAFEIEKKHYLWHIMDSIKNIEEKMPKEQYAKRSLLIRLRRFLKICKSPILDNGGLYEIAYPKTFRWRWAIATKIKRTKGN